MTDIQEIILGHGENQLSGLYAPAVGTSPKALIFAIHGGMYGSEYFNLEQELSLLKLGAEMGYSVVSIDRPGYGIAVDRPNSFDGQIPAIQMAINEAFEKYGLESAGYFLVGHSIGAMISVILANENKTYPLLGLDLSGAGLLFHEQTKKALRESILNGYVQMEAHIKGSIMYGPEWTRSSEVVAKDIKTFICPIAEVEIEDALRWDERILEESSSIRVPVHFALGEFDNIWQCTNEVMSRVPSLFSSTPFIDVDVQRFSGHCNHLHKMGKAYNMQTLSFLEECILYHQNTTTLKG